MKAPKIRISKIKYFDIKKYWRRLKPIYQSAVTEAIWKLNMRDWQEQRSAGFGFNCKFDQSKYQLPCHHDSCDWRCDHRGRTPAFWDYVCHGACHFVVDMNLHVAMTAYPKIPWRIITQRNHSTIWNGSTTDPVLFDPNFLALNVTPVEAWKTASRGRFLKPGQPLRPYVFQVGYFSGPERKRVLKSCRACTDRCIAS